MIDLKEIIQLYKEKRIKLDSESKYRQMWTVDSHTVMIQVKKGRRVLTCDCENHTRYCDSSALCRHKEAVIAFPVIKKMQEELDKKVETFNALKLGSTEEIKKILDTVLFELEDLQKLRWVRQLKYR